MGHGCMPICIARKATRTMQPTGIAGPVSPSAENLFEAEWRRIAEDFFETPRSMFLPETSKPSVMR